MGSKLKERKRAGSFSAQWFGGVDRINSVDGKWSGMIGCLEELRVSLDADTRGELQSDAQASNLEGEGVTFPPPS